MTIEELKEIIARDECETIEFKESTGQRVDACETLCAFLNPTKFPCREKERIHGIQRTD